MGTKSSNGRPGRYSPASRAPRGCHAESDAEGSGRGWSEADARIIAGHYLANLLVDRPCRRPTREGTRAVVAAPRVRGAQRRLQAWAYALPAAQPGRGVAGDDGPAPISWLKRLWTFLRELFGGAGHHPLISASSYPPVARRSSSALWRHGRGRE